MIGIVATGSRGCYPETSVADPCSKIKSHKTVGIKDFLLFLLYDSRTRIQVRTSHGSGSATLPGTMSSVIPSLVLFHTNSGVC